MKKIRVMTRPLSYGEMLEIDKQGKAYGQRKTSTHSVKVASGWYRLFQKRKK